MSESATALPTDDSRPQRRRFRPTFTLRQALLGVLVIAVLLTVWVAWKRRQSYSRQQAVAAEIVRLNGTVEFAPGPSWHAAVFGDELARNVVGISVHDSFDDEHLQALGVLPKLRHLDLLWCNVSNEGLPALLSHSRLDSLNLIGTRVTDDGLETIGRLESLVELQIGDGLELSELLPVKMGDDGLRHLIGMQNLRSLIIQGPQYTDAAVEHLRSMQQLEYVSLSYTSITYQGYSTIQQALPSCEIGWAPDTIQPIQ